MTAPTNRFGMKCEQGVLLLTQEDVKARRQRESLRVGSICTAVFTAGLASPWPVVHAETERHIRNLNIKHFPELPYSKCVMLQKYGRVEYNGKSYKDPNADNLEECVHRPTYDAGTGSWGGGLD